MTEIEESVTELTCSGAEPETPIKVAEMLAVPGPTAITVLPARMAATRGLLEVHVDSRLIT